METQTAWMQPPFGRGEPKEIPVDELTPYMVRGWTQCDPPSNSETPAAPAKGVSDGE